MRELHTELAAERAKSAGLESHVDYLQRIALENEAVLDGYVRESTQLWKVVDEIVIPAFTECDKRCGRGALRLELLKKELPERFNEAQLLATIQAEEDWSTGT